MYLSFKQGLGVFLAFAVFPGMLEPVCAQPIFTTAPPALSRVLPQAPAGDLAPPPAVAAAQRVQEPAARRVEEPAAPVARPLDMAPAPVVVKADQAPLPTFAPPAPVVAISDKSSLSTMVPPAHEAAEQMRAQETATAGGPSLRHLNNNMQGFRFAGEIASTEWPVYITASQARQKISFQVGYLSAVSVMPEASYLTLIVNDKVVGRVNIRTAHSVRTISYELPPGLMQQGFNSLRMTVEQRHRVDCSLSATYELWTQIDPSQTGLLFAQTEGATTLADLSALSPDSQGSLPIRAVTPDRSSLPNVERFIHVAQMISLVGRFAQPVIDYGPLARGAYGLNLVVGRASEIATLVDLSSLGPIHGPRVVVQPARPDRRTTVVVTGLTDSQVAEAMTQFKPETGVIGAPAGIRAAAAFPGYRMEGGQHVRLRDLGVTSEEFSGRLFRTSFNIIMPPDFYSADYAKAELALAGGYAPGLTSDAKIIVSVNGRNAVSLKLPKSKGDVFENNMIPLPLGAMRPGLNRVDIEAHAPMASDAACDPLAAISGAKRFLFLDSTRLILPRIARIARMPDLAVTTTGGFPFAGGLRPKLIVPAPDRDTIGAATTIAAHMAIAAGRPISFSLSATLPEPGDGAVLVVGGANILEPVYVKLAGVSPKQINDAWAERFDVSRLPVKSEILTRFEASARHRLMLERNFPAACRMATPPGGFERMANGVWRDRAIAPAASVSRRSAMIDLKAPSRPVDRLPVGSLKFNGSTTGALFEEWNAKVRAHSGAGAYISNAFESAMGWFTAKWAGANAWVDAKLSSARSSETVISSRASLLVAQNILGGTSEDVWTVITAPNSRELAESVPCLVDPRVWGKISGRMSMLDTDEGSVISAPVDASRLIVTHALSIDNLRLIAAGWLSLNWHVYVLLALGMALVLAVSTARFVRNVGRKT